MGDVQYPGLQTMDFNLQKPFTLKTQPVPQLNFNNFNPPNIPYSWKDSWNQMKTNLERNYIANKELKLENNNQPTIQTPYKPTLKDQATATSINALSSQLSGLASDQIFDDSELGRTMGTLFSTGLSTTADTMSNNILKGIGLTKGLGKNLGVSLGGAGAGIAANYIGQGLTSAMGDSRLGRAVGTGFATGAGALGGQAISNIMNGKKAFDNISMAFKSAKGLDAAGKAVKAAAVTNLTGLGMGVAGAVIGAAAGPSKEYNGKYGNITRNMDMAYDALTMGANFIPGAGQMVSGIMALNKGLSNIFGSTDGMTKTDAILGSAFMPAPVKWLNMAGANTTDTFRNQSWQNSQKASSFMGNAFGNLNDKFDKAREAAGKTYGTFSSSAYDDAQSNLLFANDAWQQILKMSDQNIYQNIRSQDMASINSQRYAQNIQGGWGPVARGKYGMKILNNATNHKIGMRLLSGAALIDNKQMILCNVHD